MAYDGKSTKNEKIINNYGVALMFAQQNEEAIKMFK
jgi:hypothetical protein